MTETSCYGFNSTFCVLQLLHRIIIFYYFNCYLYFIINEAGFYASGAGVTKNEAEAVRLYRLAADKGNAAAQFNLGVCTTMYITLFYFICAQRRRYIYLFF